MNLEPKQAALSAFDVIEKEREKAPELNDLLSAADLSIRNDLDRSLLMAILAARQKRRIGWKTVERMMSAEDLSETDCAFVSLRKHLIRGLEKLGLPKDKRTGILKKALSGGEADGEDCYGRNCLDYLAISYRQEDADLDVDMVMDIYRKLNLSGESKTNTLSRLLMAESKLNLGGKFFWGEIVGDNPKAPKEPSLVYHLIGRKHQDIGVEEAREAVYASFPLLSPQESAKLGFALLSSDRGRKIGEGGFMEKVLEAASLSERDSRGMNLAMRAAEEVGGGKLNLSPDFLWKLGNSSEAMTADIEGRTFAFIAVQYDLHKNWNADEFESLVERSNCYGCSERIRTTSEIVEGKKSEKRLADFILTKVEFHFREEFALKLIEKTPYSREDSVKAAVAAAERLSKGRLSFKIAEAFIRKSEGKLSAAARAAIENGKYEAYKELVSSFGATMSLDAMRCEPLKDWARLKALEMGLKRRLGSESSPVSKKKI